MQGAGRRRETAEEEGTRNRTRLLHAVPWIALQPLARRSINVARYLRNYYTSLYSAFNRVRHGFLDPQTAATRRSMHTAGALRVARRGYVTRSTQSPFFVNSRILGVLGVLRIFRVLAHLGRFAVLTLLPVNVRALSAVSWLTIAATTALHPLHALLNSGTYATNRVSCVHVGYARMRTERTRSTSPSSICKQLRLPWTRFASVKTFSLSASSILPYSEELKSFGTGIGCSGDKVPSIVYSYFGMYSAP